MECRAQPCGDERRESTHAYMQAHTFARSHTHMARMCSHRSEAFEQHAVECNGVMLVDRSGLQQVDRPSVPVGSRVVPSYYVIVMTTCVPSTCPLTCLYMYACVHGWSGGQLLRRLGSTVPLDVVDKIIDEFDSVPATATADWRVVVIVIVVIIANSCSLSS